jgi:alpha-1,2-mannosyltransferase
MLDRSRVYYLFLRVYVVVAIVLSLWLLVETLPKVVEALQVRPWDAIGDWNGARSFWRGENPFSPEGMKENGMTVYGMGHPPTTPFWFLPLAHLDKQMVTQVLGHIVMLVLLLHMLLLSFEIRLPASLVTAILLYSLTLSRSWMVNHLAMAQTSELIAFTYLLGWYFLRRNEEIAAGVALGLACTFKLFPGLMVLFLLIVRRWRAFAAACAAYLAIAAVMTARFGLIAWKQFFLMQPGIANMWIGHIRNASLHGITLRLFYPICRPYGPTRPDATALAVGSSLLLLTLAAWLARRAARSERMLDLAYALFSVLSVFLNPWVWEHYAVLLILPLFVAAVGLLEAWRQATWRGGRGGAALGFGLLACVVGMLSMDMFTKTNILAAYLHGDHRLHSWLHLAEVANWLPFPLMILVLGMLLHRAGKAAPAGRSAPVR